ncbi:MAG: type II toxin-antitoxin system HicA family toxin [Chloroflexi bacterium]|nr:type II toxin-antitoxin system HicA family toxin [Chloroflexota bacterium]
MNPKLPIVSGRQAVRAFERIGYRVVRQRGSHIRLRDDAEPRHRPLTVPDHPILKPGLLHQLLRDANLGVEEFIALLK